MYLFSAGSKQSAEVIRHGFCCGLNGESLRTIGSTFGGEKSHAIPGSIKNNKPSMTDSYDFYDYTIICL